MIRVELASQSSANPILLASFAAKTCYEGDKPQLGKLIDVEKRLFNVGHHTTLQHSYFTFFMEGIAISDVTLGLHLASPFYNTSQRSGRFCATMFENPNFDEIEKIKKYIGHYWPEISAGESSDIMDVIKEGIEVYRSNIKDAAKIAAELIRKERPHASDSYVEKNASKFAQEQLRVFIPTIFPTALTFTVNLSALTALYRSAWSPTLVDLTQQMASIVLSQYPELRYMFERKNASFDMSALIPGSYQGIAVKPKLKLIDAGNHESFVIPSESGEDTHPIDLLHFDPRYMDNNTEEIKTEVEISLATMGQDQRHRTVRRSLPRFTGKFYLPPIASELGLKKLAETFFKSWLELFKPLKFGHTGILHSLVCAIAPYGAMVKYKKSASYNATMHEAAKRLCWCSQEEIYNLNLILRKEIISAKGSDSPLLSIFPPACVRTGKCGEGDRYCGRNMKEDCFVERRV